MSQVVSVMLLPRRMVTVKMGPKFVNEAIRPPTQQTHQLVLQEGTIATHDEKMRMEITEIF
jgi:hypothetical protein